jgi:hypothetical protein
VHDATLRLGLQRKFLCHARRVFIEITPQVLVLQHYFVGIPQVSNAPCRMSLKKRMHSKNYRSSSSRSNPASR